MGYHKTKGWPALKGNACTKKAMGFYGSLDKKGGKLSSAAYDAKREEPQKVRALSNRTSGREQEGLRLNSGKDKLSARI